MCKYCACVYFHLGTAGISKNIGFHNISVMMNAYSPTLLITHSLWRTVYMSRKYGNWIIFLFEVVLIPLTFTGLDYQTIMYWCPFTCSCLPTDIMKIHYNKQLNYNFTLANFSIIIPLSLLINVCIYFQSEHNFRTLCIHLSSTTYMEKHTEVEASPYSLCHSTDQKLAAIRWSLCAVTLEQANIQIPVHNKTSHRIH